MCHVRNRDASEFVRSLAFSGEDDRTGFWLKMSDHADGPPTPSIDLIGYRRIEPTRPTIVARASAFRMPLSTADALQITSPTNAANLPGRSPRSRVGLVFR